MINKIKLAFFILFCRGGENLVAVYVFMILNDKITFGFANVPAPFKPQVKLALEEMGVGHLAE